MKECMRSFKKRVTKSRKRVGKMVW